MYRSQVRVGLLAAGNFGVPQGRWRCFLWAAAPGQQLPAIPKPTHNCIHFKAGSRRDSQAAAPRCVGPRGMANGGQDTVMLWQPLPALWRPTQLPIECAVRCRPTLQCATANNAKRLTSGFVSNEDCTMNGHPPVRSMSRQGAATCCPRLNATH